MPHTESDFLWRRLKVLEGPKLPYRNNALLKEAQTGRECETGVHTGTVMVKRYRREWRVTLRPIW